MFRVILQLSNAPPDRWEAASQIGQVILVFVGIGSFIAAAMALVESARARRAGLLLQLDERFDSSDMKDARGLLYKKLDEVQHAVSAANPLASEAERSSLCRGQWAALLKDMRANQNTDYMRLLVFAGFFETVGLMVKLRYIAATDVIALLKGPIHDMGMAFRDHIAERTREAGTPTGLLEHAFSLADRVAEQAKK